MFSPTLKKSLKARAHSLKPVVLLGQHGVTPAVLKEIQAALLYHELIKIKLPQVPASERAVFISQILEDTRAQLIQSIGRIVILYKEKSNDKASSATSA